jgi:cell fate regulator YaaT (PSP1 superfamily)
MTEAGSETTGLHWVRLGTRGDCRPVASGWVALHRGDRIICRTDRGLEFAQVLSACVCDHEEPVGRWVRHAQPEDELLWSKLQELSFEAAEACQCYLREQQSSDVLLEVEPLLDGKTLYFHFLGEPSEVLSSLLQQLVDVYQASVAGSQFAIAVEQGCGPECGTGGKSACGSGGGCASCSVVKRCSSSRMAR